MSNGREEVDRLQHEVDGIRGNIGALMRELNQRRHDAVDLKLQLHRHPARLVIAGVAVLALVAGGIAYVVARMRRRRSIKGRVLRLREALHRISAHPERVAERKPTVSRKVLAAGGSAVATAIGKRFAKRFVSG
ncbi:MAG TPA: hypothetical protein VIF57_25815 [Polyangia bacterium]|jgi:hypothetical protein